MGLVPDLSGHEIDTNVELASQGSSLAFHYVYELSSILVINVLKVQTYQQEVHSLVPY